MIFFFSIRKLVLCNDDYTSTRLSFYDVESKLSRKLFFALLNFIVLLIALLYLDELAIRITLPRAF